MDLHDRYERSVQVIRLWLLRVEDLYGVCAAGNGEDGTSEEVLGELLGVESSRGDDELQIWSTIDGLCKNNQYPRIEE